MNDETTVAAPTRSILCLALAVTGWLSSVPASAVAAERSELFKCIDAAGVTSIQSEPCAKGSTVVWRRDATPEAKPTPDQAALAEAKRLRDMQTVRELSEIASARAFAQQVGAAHA